MGVENNSFKKQLKEVSELIKKFELKGLNSQYMGTEKKRQESYQMLKTIAEKQNASFNNFDSVYSNLESIDLKKIAEGYLNIKKT